MYVIHNQQIILFLLFQYKRVCVIGSGCRPVGCAVLAPAGVALPPAVRALTGSHAELLCVCVCMRACV